MFVIVVITLIFSDNLLNENLQNFRNERILTQKKKYETIVVENTFFPFSDHVLPAVHV